MSAAYNLFSLLPGEPNVGIWYLSQDLAGQPVRLDVDLIEWTARPSIIGRGPTQLSAGPYRYTRDRHGEVFATNDPVSNQDWFLIPSDYDNAYL
ncbi:hypothetical protein J3R82DRAFT_4907 [Butyriboletus roseoflavus]|nr:hypothetical protein J3R82DRAFT_4989 [Butyriboletus roseoflavus]KAG8219185.1 hypothetical protein J3R82DRAFT_4907 [Butyriboletus roseoflavus]